MRSKYYKLIICIGLISIGVFLIFSSRNGVEDNLLNGQTGYSKEFGLINWGHARPNETAKSFKALQELNEISTDTFEFSYSQKMVSKFGGWNIVIGVSERRKMPPHLSLAEEKIVFLEIFTSVSYSFEQLQASFPYTIDPASRNSSFRSGDLMGNLISYYLAVSNITLDDFKNEITIISPEEYDNEQHNEELTKDYVIDWDMVIADGDPSNGVLKELQGIIDSSKGLNNPLSVKIHDDLFFCVE